MFIQCSYNVVVNSEGTEELAYKLLKNSASDLLNRPRMLLGETRENMTQAEQTLQVRRDLFAQDVSSPTLADLGGKTKGHAWLAHGKKQKKSMCSHVHL